MCRSIKTLRGTEFTDEEIATAALQFVRKVSGYRKPSKANEEVFEAAVDEIAASLQRLLEGAEHPRTWLAIWLANLSFAMTHAHLALYFIPVVIIPGLFWGWLYARQRSLVGVSVSHVLVGVWGIFIVGGRHLFG